MLLALLVGSINHNNNLGYLLTFFLVGLLFMSTLFTLRNLLGISVGGSEPRPVFAGLNCSVPLTFEAGAGLKYGINVAFSADRGPVKSIDLGKRESVTLSHPTEKRGILQLSPICLSTSFPFGLLQLQSKLPIEKTCLVFPKPVQTPLVTEFESGGELGDVQQKKKDTGDFNGLDAYRPGDNLKRIYWKGLAGGKGLHTKRFEGSEAASLIFSLQELPGSDLEIKLSQLTYMVLTAEAEGVEYGLRLGEFIIPANRGGRHKNNCLKALSLYE